MYINIYSGNQFNHNSNTAYTMTKATTVFYPTSPKNSAMTQYNLTTINETTNHNTMNTSAINNNNY